jgi:S-formylglutathione hydrolase
MMFRMSCVFTMLLLATALLGACQPTTLPPSSPSTITAALPTPVDTVAAPTATPSASSTPEVRALGKDEMTVEFVDFNSQAVAGNLLGDPATRRINILLPSGYATSGKRYPVVFVLHSFDHNSSELVYPFKTSFEKAHKAGEVRDMIMVFPDASNKLGGGWYMDSPTIGGYETYIDRELVDYVDTHFRTLAQPGSRGITGCSMGGDGAAHLALAHPDVFGVVAAVSANYDWGEPGWKEGGAGFGGPPQSLTDFDMLPFVIRVGISRAAAVAPNPDNPPFYLDMPWMLSNGEVLPVTSVIEKMDANDATEDARRYIKQPRRLAAFMLYHGTRDTYVPVQIARAYDKLLTELGIEHSLVEVDDGTHCGIDYMPVVKFMSEHLVFGTPAN